MNIFRESMSRTSRVWLAAVVAVAVLGGGLVLYSIFSDNDGGAATSAVSADSAPAGAPFPGPDDTGVPNGVSLAPFTGSCSLDVADTVIVGKIIECDLVIRASGIVIRNSEIVGRIVSNEEDASITVEDSTIDGGAQETFPTVSFLNVTLRRVEVKGGQHSVQCSANCDIENSWLHGQYIEPGSQGHLNAFISNGGSNMRLYHNTLHCSVEPTGTGGGCTADLSLFGDFGAISNVVIQSNLFKSNSTGAGYCLQAGWAPGKQYPDPEKVVVSDNVFERGENGKCGIFGPFTAFNPAGLGNVWSNNAWDDGQSLGA